MEIEDFFAGHPDADAVFETVCSVLDGLGTVEVRTSKSQVAFRGKRGFAFLWLPGQYLATPTAEVVLSIALGRHDPSTRFKQVVHPLRRTGCTSWRSMTWVTSTMKWSAGSVRQPTAQHERPDLPMYSGWRRRCPWIVERRSASRADSDTRTGQRLLTRH